MPEEMEPIARQLRSLADDGSRAAHGLAAGEVRARGQRRSRRVAVASALAILTVIGSGTIAFAAGQSIIGGTDPVSDPPPPGGWLQEIPADFVIDADPPPDDAGALTRGPEESLGVVEASICGEQGFDGSPEPVDQLGFRTALQWRALMLFTSDVDARTAFFEFWSRVRACDTDSGTDSAGDDMTSSWDTGWFAERGPYAVVRETFPNDAVAFYHLALQGNSVSVIRTDTLLSPGANVAAAVQTASEQGARAAAGLAEQLCMFRSQGCGKNLDLPFWLLYPGISPEGYFQQQLDQRQDER